MILLDCFLKYPKASIKLILRYAKERCKQHERDTAYRFYVTDSLKLIAENTACLGNGKIMSKRFCEIVYETQENKQPEKSADEIIKEITKNAGLVVIDE